MSESLDEMRAVAAKRMRRNLLEADGKTVAHLEIIADLCVMEVESCLRAAGIDIPLRSPIPGTRASSEVGRSTGGEG